ncbi:uncharacterized protein LOC114428659 [Parambassis ranga]|uniref:Uncharacterized protein LOC114428659 n=1 Tax=Parambassis ranga TaxID=210632 RepID=A0A6P7HC98_9TELE|nr:uncharacterized protein LOC114428659 [Parambassis ranga]
MDKMECNPNRRGIFANTVWQWRIMHVRKYSRNPEPFLCSNKIGLDFNVESTTKKKKDVGLLTNGVVLELCDFAKTVKESKRHLITNILEKNFDLGLENEQQRADFTKRILLKLKDLIRTPLQNKHEAFPLFDTLSVPSCTNSIENGQSVGSAEHQSNSLQELTETDYGEDEAKTEKVDGFHADDSDEDQMEWLGATEDMKADACALSFPYCQEIGLSFDLESQQHLDPDLLTKAVMLELVDFSTLLNASYSSIVLDVLDYNFELDVKSQQGQKQVWSSILHLLKRRKQFAVASAKLGPQFENEPFSIQTNPLKRPRQSCLEAPLNRNEEVTKRRKSDLKREENLFQESTTNTDQPFSSQSDDSSHLKDENQTYIPPTSTSHFTEAYAFQDMSEELPCRKKMCLANQRSDVKEAVRQKQLQIQRETVMLQSDVETDETTDSENWTDEDDLHNTTNSEINVVPPFTSQFDKSKQQRDEQQMLVPTTPTNGCDIIQDEMESMINTWKLRAKRVKQILLQMKQHDLLMKDNAWKLKYLEFNVGFAPKQNLHPDQLKYFCLYKVALFALAMNSSKSEFIMDILENNFDLGLQSEYHKHVFSCEMMTQTRELQNCEDAVKFSKEVFELPVPMSSEDMEYQIVDEGNLELSCMTGTGTYDVPLDSHLDAEPGSHAEDGTTQQESVNPYPFCKDIGLKLYVSDGRPNQKLHINKLTKGAMTEITIFAEKLCGSFEQICFDILRHNFDLDLQSVDSDLFQNILRRIPAANDVVNLACYVPSHYKDSKRNLRDASVLKELQYQNNTDLEENCVCPPRAPTEQNRRMSADTKQQHGIDLVLWKLRSNRIQRILSGHEEHCPLFSYSRCKKLGIDFNVGSGIKKNLDPKLLTNGVMVELHTFASALLSSKTDFMTEVLEYNFDLNLNTEHLRSAYAEELLSQFMKMNIKRRSVSLKKLPIQIPGPRCIKEYTPHCSKCCQDRNQMLLKDVFEPNDMFHHNLHVITDTDSGNADSTNQRHVMDPISTFQASDSFFSCYRECSKVGLNLCLFNNHPKEKLKTHEITAAAMLELLSFAKRVCGTGLRIFLDILVHNFNFDLRKPSNNFVPHFKHKPFEGGLAWFNEVYAIDQLFSKHAIKKTWTLDMQGSDRKKAVTKRILMMQRKKERALLESDSETDETTDSENGADEDDLHNTPNSEINVAPPFASQSDDSKQQAHEQQMLLPTTAPDECGMIQEEIGPESNMWKLRSKRVKQIHLQMIRHDLLMKDNTWKLKYLEFNVGFAPKQNLHPDQLKYFCLYKVALFALAMNSSKSEFIMDILENNFNLGLQSEYHKHVFSCEMMTQARKLQNCEDAVKFSKEVFELPVPMSSEDMEYQIVDEGNLEFSCMTGTGTYDVPLDSHFDAEPGSHAEDGTTQQESVDQYPFCKDIGLKLYVSDGQPNQKLHINKLTKGAMTEITIFAEKLCGSFEQICFDILRHNFDLDLQSVDSDLFQNILRRIPAANDIVNLACYLPSHYKDSKCNLRDASVLKELQYQNNTDLEENCVCPPRAPTEQNRRISADTEQQHGIDLVLWKLRSNRIQRILSGHEEHCPLFSYSRCKKLDIDFNVGSGIKKNLDPKLLTNGVMVELHTFASALLSSKTDFMTEVLEYNFDLNLNTEHLRSAYAEELLSQFMKIKTKRRSVPLKKLPIQIPGPGCIKEYTPHCSKCCQDRNQMLLKDVFEPNDMFHHNLHVITDTDSGNADSTNQRHVMDTISTFQASDSFFSCYRECSKVGLNLCLFNNHPKEKLKTHEITAAAMLELFSFANRLCGTGRRIVLDILVHNFNFDLQKPSKRFVLRFKHKPFEGGLAWFNEVYTIDQQFCKHPIKKTWTLDMQGSDRKKAVTKRILMMQRKKERALLESDSETDETTDSENGADEDDLHNTPNSEINVAPPFASQSDDSKQQAHEQQILLPTTAPNECDMIQEEIGTRSNMWKLRANRVKKILFDQCKDHCRFFNKKVYLEFNVGFMPKQNLSADILTHSVLFKVAQFAIAMSSSQPDFIMKILENNFDLCLGRVHHEDVFTCELMKKLRELQSCEDAVKFSKEVFELPDPLSAEAHPHTKADSPAGPDPHVKTKPVSQAQTTSSVDPYPFCKDIGMKLNVGNSQHNKKLHIHRLTKGAMTEVAAFAEKLCGTFDDICFDILRHNFDLDLPSIDCELFQNILAQIPAANDTVNLATISRHVTPLHLHSDPIVLQQLPCQPKPNEGEHSAVLTQAVKDHNFSRVIDAEEHDRDSFLWTLRANRVRQILSVHGEHCPLYSYSRCKKLGIDFNIGSGEKRDLDPKLLTNGIMIELQTFAKALVSSKKDFMTEILEFNFDLNLRGELHRSAYAQELMKNVVAMKAKRATTLKRNHAFEIPDPKSVVGNAPCCPKCYQDRNYAFRQDESNPDHIFHYDAHTKTDTISADCTTQKPVMDLVSDFPASEALLRLYPHCENIGLNLCVDKDHPKESLDMDLLTWTTIREVCSFAKTLSGKKQKILGDVLAHNFHLDMQNLNIHPSQFCPDTPSWFDEVFVLQTRSPTPSSEDALKIERKKAIKRQKLQKHKKAALSDNMASHLSVEKLYPLCSEIGLDLDVTSKSENKVKLDLNLLTIPVILEIQKFISKKHIEYFPGFLYDILDYNFDLSSQHHRKWEFSLETASRFRIALKKWKNKSGGEDTVFKLPFVFDKKHRKEPHRKKNKSHKQAEMQSCSGTSQLSPPSDVIFKNDGVTGVGTQTHHDIKMEMCDNLPGNLQVKEETCYVDVKPDMGRTVEATAEPNIVGVTHLGQSKSAGSCENTLMTKSVSGSETENVQYFLFAPPTASEGFRMLPPCSNIVGPITAGTATTYFVPVTGFIPVQVIPMSHNPVNISIKEEQEDMLVDLGSSKDHSNAEIEVTIKEEYDP